MTTIASRDLRNHTSDVLRKVATGSSVTLTVHGRPVATINPITDERPIFVNAREFLSELPQADPSLRDDLVSLGKETTDDLGSIL